MRVALYLRVSTLKEQHVETQRRELLAVCAARGWVVAAEFADEGISGAKGRRARPGLDAALKGATRREFDALAAWSLDRLGRSLSDLLATLSELQGAGVELYLHRQAIDTNTAAGRALFGMLGVFAEFERALISDRVRAGMARAKAAGKVVGGRGIVVTEAQRATIRAALAGGLSLRKAGAAAGVSVATAQRVKAAGYPPGCTPPTQAELIAIAFPTR